MHRAFSVLAVLACVHAHAGAWKQLPSLPDAEGFAGAFAGVSHGALIVAGGANFPGKKPWEGGTKVWYDTVFVLDSPEGAWKVAGKLPCPLGYGVSVTHGGVICIGGSDSAGHHAEVFRLDWRDGSLTTTALPSLPTPLANACGALVGDTVYVAGGQERPDATAASRRVYTLELAAKEPAWIEIASCPGSGRILAAAASMDGAFWLAGGAALHAGKDGLPARTYLKDAYRYAPGAGWKRMADMPYPVVAAPAPSPCDAKGFYVLGGDDGRQLSASPEKHRGFSRSILRYSLKKDHWAKAGTLPAPRVTAPCVAWGDMWVVPSGEARPGVRSPEVWGRIPGTKE